MGFKFRIQKPVVASEEGFLDLFRKKKPAAQGDAEETYYAIGSQNMRIIKDSLHGMTDAQFQKFSETNVSGIHKADDMLVVFKSVFMNILRDVSGKLIPKWKAMDKFEWHDEAHNPVDDSGKIKFPALSKLMSEAGQIGRSIINKSEFVKMTNYSRGNDRASGTMAEMGFTRQKLGDLLMVSDFMLNEDKQNKWGHFYIIAEDHSDGWNYVVNHVIRDYWGCTSDYPDLKPGVEVFLATQEFVDKFTDEIGRFLYRFAKATGTDLFMK